MREPNLLVISNKLKEANLEEDLEFARWDSPPEKLWTFSDYDVVIIDFSFDNDDELRKNIQWIYENLEKRLLDIAEGSMVMVICGYPDRKFEVEPFYLFPDESYYPGWGDQETPNKQLYSCYASLHGISTPVYTRLSFEPSRRYDKEVKNPFKEYFNITDIAYLTIKYSSPPPDINIEPISKTGGAGKDRDCVAALIQTKKGTVILLPGYIKSKKNEALLSLIKISKELYRQQQELKERGGE